MKPGKSDEWYTPKFIFDALGIEFDLDPCHPGERYFVPAKMCFTKEDDGLTKAWWGSVWCNPPFGGRNGQFPWIKRFIAHGDGIGLFTALTSSEGFQRFIPQMDAIVFPKGKTRFIEPGGKLGGCPFNGIVLFAIGKKNVEALRKCGLGIFFEVPKRAKHAARDGEGK